MNLFRLFRRNRRRHSRIPLLGCYLESVNSPKIYR